MNLSRLLSGSAVLALAMLVAVSGPSYAQLASGPNTAAPGYLEIGADSYGSWASTTFGGAGDTFVPTGGSVQEVAFSSGFFVFVNGSERGLLSTSSDWQDTYVTPTPPNLTPAITSPNVLSDTNSDGVNDTAVSAFTVTGGTTSLSFSLQQNVQAVGPGVSTLEQTYVVTNDGTAPVDIQMVRSMDADMVFNGGFTNDQVGTSMWGAGLGTYVFQEEAAAPGTTAVTLSSNQASAYYGGKNTVVPVGGPPNFGFGTDVQIYDNFGVPTSWANEIANVGNGINGVSGTNPNNAISGAGDGFIGLQFLLAGLQPNETRTLMLTHTYGQNAPVPEPSGLALIVSGIVFGFLRSAAAKSHAEGLTIYHGGGWHSWPAAALLLDSRATELWAPIVC